MTVTVGSSDQRLTLLRERRQAARSQRLSELLRQRPDLAGVHAPADWADEAVRGSVCAPGPAPPADLSVPEVAMATSPPDNSAGEAGQSSPGS